MRNTPALIATALLGTAVLSACAESIPEVRDTSIPSDEPVADVYVLDLNTFEGEDIKEISLQTPETLTLSEFSFADELDWESWGGDSAVASGRINGMFCESGCEGEAYEVTVVLCEVADGHYRRFGVFGDFPEFDDTAWTFGGPLYIGGRPAGDDDWSNGCEEPEPSERA